MSIEILTVFIILVVALILFVFGLVAVDVTAIIVMVGLMVTGILTPEEGVSGFSNPATLTVLALLIISEGLKTTGAVDLLGDKVTKIAGRTEWVTILVVMLISAIASAFINTTAVVAVFIPVVFRISRATGIHVSMLLMPLSFSAMIGGASTMVGTSTNLLINSLSVANGLEKFRIFDLSLMGVILFVSLALFFLFIGRFLLKNGRHAVIDDQETDIKDYILEVEVKEKSSLIGKKLENSLLLKQSDDFKVLRVVRENATHPPLQVDKLQENDVLVIKTNIKEVLRLNKDENVQLLSRPTIKLDEEKENNYDLFEALITPNSGLIDQKIKAVNFEKYYNAYPLAVRNKGVMGQQKMMDHKLKLGDILLMEGDVSKDTLYSRKDWVAIQKIAKEKLESNLYRRDKLAISVFILIGVIGLAVSNILPILISAWLGVVAMVLTRSISLKIAYENVEWKVFFLLAGLIPLGTAMTKTKADEYLADLIVHMTWGNSPIMVISVLFIFTTLFTGIVSNQATAVLLVPIAIKVAASLSMPPEPLVIAILFGANTSFLTPVGYQTNAMIYGPGNYKFVDYLKVGGVLCLIFWGIATFLIPKLYM